MSHDPVAGQSFALPSARLLLIEPDPVHRRRLSEVLEADFPGLAEVAAPTGVVDPERWDIVVASYDLPEKDRVLLLEACGSFLRRHRLLLYSGPCDRAVLAALVGDHGMTNILARNEQLDGRELLVTLRKMLQQNLYGAEVYLDPVLASESLRLTVSSARNDALEKIEEFATAAGLGRRLVGHFVTAAEELISNAFYNAPVDDEGRPLYSHIRRTEDVHLDAEHAITIDLASDGQRVALTVGDPFGSLKVDTITSYLGKCFRSDQDQIDEKEGGAGLGIYYAFASLSHFVVNIHPGHRTEVIGLMELHGNFRSFARSGKSFNVFLAAEAREDAQAVLMVESTIALAGASSTLPAEGKERALVRLELPSQLSEKTDFSAWLSSLGDIVEIDASQLRRINSQGVREWVYFLREAVERADRVELHRCSPEMVHQMNMVKSASAGAHVISVQLPLICEACDAESVLDAPLPVDGSLPTIAPDPCESCGRPLVLDDELSSYLAFTGR